ncbi:MAG: YkgJ family cysteine cluster protein [Parachlamydiaceae bacterium]|nr:YkgJ family cysteine cluster protein [Parachlamydiaceae bacterium]
MSDRLNVLHVKEPQPWFSSGLRFKCTGCGQCCTGAPGHVWVTDDEIASIADYLKMTIDEFRMKYLRLVGDRESLLEDSRTFDCIFLKDKKCKIYPVRPSQCQTFPWWPYNLQSEAQWNEAGKDCEGINHPEAPLISAESILQQKSLTAKQEI